MSTKSTCDDILLFNIQTNLTNQQLIINFITNRNKAYKNWQAKASTLDADIAAAKANIASTYASGTKILKYNDYPGYITDADKQSVGMNSNNNEDYWMSHIVYNNSLYTCPGAGSDFGTCSTTIDTNLGNIIDKRCCACGKYRRCSPAFGDCGANGTTPGVCDSMLTSDKNIFNSIIQSKQDSEVARLTGIVNNLKSIYDAIVASPPVPLPLSNIQCCQTQIFNGISASDVLFNNVTQCCQLANDPAQKCLTSTSTSTKTSNPIITGSTGNTMNNISTMNNIVASNSFNYF
jgi:hypothetical protein